MSGCVFCQIAGDIAPAHVIWENTDHLAFLSIFPNTTGATVVIPRAHWPSYIAETPVAVAHGLYDAAAEVAALLDTAFTDVARTAVVFEGYGVNHLHAKLFPLHGTAGNGDENWQPVSSSINHWMGDYQGYISSHDGHRAADTQLATLARDITAAAYSLRPNHYRSTHQGLA